MRIEQLTPEQQAFVASVYTKCVEVGDCRIWTGKKTDTGYPRMSRRGRWFIVRRELASIKAGRPLTAREMASCTCDDPACLEWDHIEVADVQAVRERAGAAGKYSTPSKAMRIAITKRRGAKIDIQTARAIRASEDPSESEAEKHGISPSMVRRIRNNEKWREYDSPFQGLGAR